MGIGLVGGLRNALSGVFLVGSIGLVTGCGSAPREDGTARVRQPIWGDKTEETLLDCQSALSGSTALVGCGTSAAVYEHSAAGWTVQQQLAATDFESGRLALAGDTVAFGGTPGSHESARAQVFVRSGSAWTEQQVLVPEARLTDFADVAVSGDT